MSQAVRVPLHETLVSGVDIQVNIHIFYIFMLSQDVKYFSLRVMVKNV